MDYSEFSDRQMVEAYISGQESVLNEIIRRHQSRVFGYIMMSVKDRDVANDIFQDTFVKVIRKLKEGTYRDEGKFIQWVMRIAHNLIIDHFRKSKKVSFVESQNNEYDVFDTIRLTDPSVEERLVTKQIHSDVNKLLQYLPDEQKEVIMLRCYAGLSFRDIAEQTDVSINTALGRMRYALINLRKLIEERKLVLTS